MLIFRVEEKISWVGIRANTLTGLQVMYLVCAVDTIPSMPVSIVGFGRFVTARVQAVSRGSLACRAPSPPILSCLCCTLRRFGPSLCVDYQRACLLSCCDIR